MKRSHLLNVHYNGSEPPQNPNYVAPPTNGGYPPVPPPGYYYYPPQPPPGYYPPQPPPPYHAHPSRWNGKYDNSGQQKICNISNKTCGKKGNCN